MDEFHAALLVHLLLCLEDNAKAGGRNVLQIRQVKHQSGGGGQYGAERCLQLRGSAGVQTTAQGQSDRGICKFFFVFLAHIYILPNKIMLFVLRIYKRYQFCAQNIQRHSSLFLAPTVPLQQGGAAAEPS